MSSNATQFTWTASPSIRHQHRVPDFLHWLIKPHPPEKEQKWVTIVYFSIKHLRNNPNLLPEKELMKPKKFVFSRKTHVGMCEASTLIGYLIVIVLLVESISLSIWDFVSCWLQLALLDDPGESLTSGVAVLKASSSSTQHRQCSPPVFAAQCTLSGCVYICVNVCDLKRFLWRH